MVSMLQQEAGEAQPPNPILTLIPSPNPKTSRPDLRLLSKIEILPKKRTRYQRQTSKNRIQNT